MTVYADRLAQQEITAQISACTSKAAAGSDTGMGSVVCEVPAEPWHGPKEIGLPAKAQAVFSMWELVPFVQLWLARAPSGHVLAYWSRLSSTTDQ